MPQWITMEKGLTISVIMSKTTRWPPYHTLRKTLLKYVRSDLHDVWDLEKFSKQNLFIIDYLNHYSYGGIQIFSQKPIMLNPSQQQRFEAVWKFHRVRKRLETFVEIAVKAYYAGFRMDFDIVSASTMRTAPDLTCSQNAKAPGSVYLPGEKAATFELLLLTKFKNSIYLPENILVRGNDTQIDDVTRIRATRMHTNMGISVSKYSKGIH